MGLRAPAGVKDITLTDEEIQAILNVDPEAELPADKNGNPTMNEDDYRTFFGKEPGAPAGIVQDTLKRDNPQLVSTPPESTTQKMLRGLETLNEVADTYGGGGAVRTPALEALKEMGLKVPETEFKTGRAKVPSFVDVAMENMPAEASFLRKAVTYPAAFAADIATDPISYTPAGAIGLFSKARGLTKLLGSTGKMAKYAAPIERAMIRTGEFVKPAEQAVGIALNLPTEAIAGAGKYATKRFFRAGYKGPNARLATKLERVGNEPTYMTDEMLKQGYAGGNVDAFLEGTKARLGSKADEILEEAPAHLRVQPTVAMAAPAELSAGHMGLHGTPLPKEEYDAAMAYVKSKLGTNLPKETYDRLVREHHEYNKAMKAYEQAKQKIADITERNKVSTGVKEQVPALPEKPTMSSELAGALEKQKIEHPEVNTLLPTDPGIQGLTLPEIKQRLTATAADLPPQIWKADSMARAKFRAAQLGMQKLREAAASKLSNWSPLAAQEFEKVTKEIRPFLAESGILLKAAETPASNPVAAAYRFGQRNVSPFAYQTLDSPLAKNVFKQATRNLYKNKVKEK